MRTKLLAFLSLLFLSAPAFGQFLGPPTNVSIIDSGVACSVTLACASFTSGTAVSLSLDVSGTWTGTLTFEQTSNGSNWRTLWVTNAATGVQVSSTTAGGSWTVANNFIGVRLRATGAMTGLAVVTATRGYGVSTHLFDASVITGVVAAVNGGTGQSSYAVGDLLSANTTTTLSKVAAVAAGQVLASAGTSTLPAYTATPTVTSLTAAQTALGTTLTDGVVLTNTTAAAAGAQQISPSAHWTGQGWSTNAGGASMAVDWRGGVLPVQGAAAPTSQLEFASSINGSAYTTRSSLTSAGLLTVTNLTAGTSVLCGSQCNIGSGGAFRSNSNGTNITMPADGQANLNNNAVSAGFGFDFATDVVAKFRVRAQNAYATVDALAYQASGTAITSGTTHLSAGAGMAVANVGANSCGTSAASIVGNNNAFVVTVGATSGTQCRVAFTVTAATGWVCAANDDTTTVAVRTTPVDTTHLDLIGTFTAADNISGICFPR